MTAIATATSTITAALAGLATSADGLSADTTALLQGIGFARPALYTERFDADAYPYRYAYEYIVDNTPGITRLGDASDIVMRFAGFDRATQERICRELADAYCAQRGIAVPGR